MTGISIVCVFLLICIAAAALIAHATINLLHQIIDENNEQIISLERENLVLNEACDALIDDLCSLGEAVDDYLMTNDMEDLEAIEQIMCYIENKYNEEDCCDGDSEESIVKETIH